MPMTAILLPSDPALIAFIAHWVRRAQDAYWEGRRLNGLADVVRDVSHELAVRAADAATGTPVYARHPPDGRQPRVPSGPARRTRARWLLTDATKRAEAHPAISPLRQSADAAPESPMPVRQGLTLDRARRADRAGRALVAKNRGPQSAPGAAHLPVPLCGRGI